MDFSSVSRSLQSLLRRSPPLEEGVLDAAQELLKGDGVKSMDSVVALLQQTHSSRWEPLAVGLYVATEALVASTVCSDSGTSERKEVYVDGPRVPSIQANTNMNKQDGVLTNDEKITLSLGQDDSLLAFLCSPLLMTCQTNLEHDEPRVRTLVAKAVGAEVKYVLLHQNTDLIEHSKSLHASIVQSLQNHLEQGRDELGNYSRSSTGAMDDTTGWRALETNWQGLASYIAACDDYYPIYHPLSSELLDMCFRSSVEHVNRHVRAAAMAVMEQWVSCDAKSLGYDSPLRQTVVKVLKETLADNWSQVRMAASVLCRTFWLAFQKSTDVQDCPISIHAILIPRMCLNRFYWADGVKLYSHETWKLVFPQGGLSTVASCAAAVCRYYVKMCDADNHAVREAACQAVAELAQKLGSDPQWSSSLDPHVHILLQALLMCFHDESWPVRDEAAVACGTFCRAYPDECRCELPILLERWTDQLTDQIWSIRQNAAMALGDAVTAYGDEILSHVMEILSTQLSSARNQPAMTREEYKRIQNDVENIPDRQLYNPESVNPTLRKKGGARFGCGMCDINRPKAPWEATDGCIYLIRELLHCPNKLGDDVWLPIMTELADVCRVKHFPQGDDLRTTLWKQLPAMAQSLGKQRFKRNYLSLFLDLLMSNLEERTASALSKHAAGQCAEELAQFVGVSIFRGRLDDYQRETLDMVLRERKQMPRGPVAEVFSPFGPPDRVQAPPLPGFRVPRL